MNSSIILPVASVDLSSTIIISSLSSGYSRLLREFKHLKIFSPSFLAATITVALGRFAGPFFGNLLLAPIIKRAD